MTNHIGLDELAIQEGIRKPWETLLMMTKTPYGLYAFTHKDLGHFASLIAAHEREACASICFQEGPSIDRELIAEAIRARGNT